jgi:predicted dithiol-disulfide oxidoreductase (DUF899 family)
MPIPKIATRQEWLKLRFELLKREKQFTHERESLAKARQELPMVLLEKTYRFEGPQGPVSLGDLFQARRQLIVYHFMFHPDLDQGCKHCSCVMDNIAGGLIHLQARDTSFAAVSRAPMTKIQAFKRRMGWTFPWVSSFESEFNYDFQVTLDPAKGFTTHNFKTMDWEGELPGLSVFFRSDGKIYHSYSTYLRGLDIFLPMYHLLDSTPLGRQETPENSMAAGEDSWIRFHDSYGSGEKKGACCE